MILQTNFLIILQSLIGLRRRNLAILLLRGGLGNQLHQIAGLLYYSDILDFDVMVYDGNLSGKVYAEGGSTHLKALHVENWFPKGTALRFATGLAKLLLKSMLSFLSKINRLQILKVNDLKLPNIKSIVFIQDFFQEKKYALAVENHRILKIFGDQNEFFKEAKNSKVAAIHIRLTDYYKVDDQPLAADDYGLAIEKLQEFGVTHFDCFSDDLENAKALLPIGKGVNFSFPEERMTLDSRNVLRVISSYDYIIASRSSLCWWACYLASVRNPKSIVYHFWNQEYALELWKKTSSL